MHASLVNVPCPKMKAAFLRLFFLMLIGWFEVQFLALYRWGKIRFN
jgi:hypothetical protein